MGWKGYEAEIPAGMVFKKMYCHKCGEKFKIKKISYILKKGEDGYSNDILGHPTIGMDKKEIWYYIYKCPNCGFEISYDEQVRISKIQKKKKKKILTENDFK